jgi:hypothetical protein
VEGNPGLGSELGVLRASLNRGAKPAREEPMFLSNTTGLSGRRQQEMTKKPTIFAVKEKEDWQRGIRFSDISLVDLDKTGIIVVYSTQRWKNSDARLRENEYE